MEVLLLDDETKTKRLNNDSKGERTKETGWLLDAPFEGKGNTLCRGERKKI